LFYVTVAPAFALTTVLGIAATGGYRYTRRYRIRPVVVGSLTGLLFVATLSFFIKEIAFSRVVILVLCPATMLILSLRRRLARSSRPAVHRALLVGRPAEAQRLHKIVDRHPSPPFSLVGFVSPDNQGKKKTASGLPRIGFLRHLRDIVRLQQIDEIIFAAGELSNTAIFRAMQQLQDLPVQFKMLAEGHTHVIGKASVEDLSFPDLIEAEEAIGEMRTAASRRAFEIPIALLGLVIHPFLLLLSRLTGGLFFKALAHRTRLMPAVLTGRLALIGYDEARNAPPPDDCYVYPAVFSVLDSIRLGTNGKQDSGQVYWFYARNQNATLDWNILVRNLRMLRRSSRHKRVAHHS
jgi:hypothetical protein